MEEALKLTETQGKEGWRYVDEGRVGGDSGRVGGFRRKEGKDTI